MTTNIDDIMNSDNDQREIAETYGLETYIENGRIFADDAKDITEIPGGFNTPAGEAGPAPVEARPPENEMSVEKVLSAIGTAFADYDWSSLPKDTLHGASIGAENINKLIGTDFIAEGFNNAVKSVMGDEWYNKHMTIDPPKQAVGQFASAIGQYLPGGIPAVRVMKLIAASKGVGARALSEIFGGFAGDYATSSVKEANDFVGMLKLLPETTGLADQLQNWLKNPDGTESDLRSRLLAGLPGLLISAPMEGAISGFTKIARLARESGGGDDLVESVKEFETNVEVDPAPSKPEGFVASDQPAAKPDEMGFRSGVISALEVVPENATGDQILATLRNPQTASKYGYRLEELDHLRLDQLLAGKETSSATTQALAGKATFTRQELSDHIEKYRLGLDERVKSGGQEPDIDPETDWFDVLSETDSDFIWSNTAGDPESNIIQEGVVTRRDPDGEVVEDVIIYKFLDLEDLLTRDRINRELELVIDSDERFFNPDRSDLLPDIKAGLDEIERTHGRYGPQYRSDLLPDIKAGLDEIERTHADIRLYRQGELASFTRKQKDEHNQTVSVYKEALGDFRKLLKDVHGINIASYFDAVTDGFAKYRVWNLDGGYRDFNDELAAQHQAKSLLKQGQPGETRWGDLTFPMQLGKEPPKNYKEILVDFPAGDKRFPEQDRHGHWGAENFFHVRTSERELVDQGGNKLGPGIFIEETQSDIVQQATGWVKSGTDVEEIKRVYSDMVRDVPHRIYGQLRNFVSDPDTPDNLTIVTRGAPGGGVVPKDSIDDIKHDEIRGIISRIAERVREDKSNPNILADIQSGAISISGISNTREGLKHQAVAQLLDQADVEKWIKADDDFAAVAQGTMDFPMRNKWLELAIKRGIWEGVQEGRQYIAFPTNRNTIAMIEGHTDPASGALQRTYEKDIPKILKRLAKKYGGTLSEGSIEGSPHHTNNFLNVGYREIDWRAEGGQVTILTLPKEAGNKIRKEGFALPSVVLGGAVASQLMEGSDDDGT
jgi:hypothetical protein